MATLLPRQDIAQQAADIKNTFSSWDSCMAKSYCKWPAIVAIIIGSLIVLTILYCLSRCICCGKDLVCCCFRCCGRSRGHKHLDSVPQTPYHNNNQQYQSHPPPMYGAGAPVYGGPSAFSQTATFESMPKGAGGGDSLPAMPSWETAESRRVEVMEEPESHEMDRLHTGVTSPLRESTASPLPRPIPLRNESGGSVGSPRLPNVGYERSPYGSDANVGPYGSRTQFQGSNANLHNSRTNLTGNGDYGYQGRPAESPSHAPPSRQYGNPYGQDSHYDDVGYDTGRRDQYAGGYNRAPSSPAPAYTGPNGHDSYNRSPVHNAAGGNDGFNRSPVYNSAGGNDGGFKAYSPVQDRYGGANTGNSGGPRPYGNSPYGNNPYGSRPGQGSSYRDI